LAASVACCGAGTPGGAANCFVPEIVSCPARCTTPVSAALAATALSTYCRDATCKATLDGTTVERIVAILPVAAIEQHGPHLPLGVDAIINEGIVRAAMPLMPDSVLVLPTMEIGKSNEHQAFPGTLTLSAETLIRLWTEIGDSVARAGVRKLLIFNSHGGQTGLPEVVATDLRARLGMIVGWAVPAPLARRRARSARRRRRTGSMAAPRKPRFCSICDPTWSGGMR